MLSSPVAAKPTMKKMRGGLSSQHPVLHPRYCPVIFKPNHISCNLHASPSCKSLPALRALAVRTVTPKSFSSDFLCSPSEDIMPGNRRDLDCRYLEQKSLEGKRGLSDDYYAVSEPNFNELVRSGPELERRLMRASPELITTLLTKVASMTMSTAILKAGVQALKPTMTIFVLKTSLSPVFTTFFPCGPSHTANDIKPWKLTCTLDDDKYGSMLFNVHGECSFG